MDEQNINPQGEDEFDAAEETVETGFETRDPEDDGGPMWEGEEGDVEPDPEPEAEEANPEDEVADGEAAQEADAPEVDDTPVRDWDHNVDSLPGEIVQDGVRVNVRELYQDMVRGYQASNQRAVAAEKTAAAAEAQYKQLMGDVKAGNEDVRPANPTTDMTEQEQNQRYEDIQRWIYRDEARKQRLGSHADPSTPPPEAAPAFTQEDVNRLETMLVKQEGYTQDVAAGMGYMLQNDPYWSKSGWTDDGALKLFELVKTQVEANAAKEAAGKLERDAIRRKAKAGDNAVPSPSRNRKTTARAQDFEKKIQDGTATWEDAERAV